MDMHYRLVSEGIPKVDVIGDYAAQDWYKMITQKATAISQLGEMALVGAGMSLLWVPKNPLGQPVYSYQGKFGYSLINVLDPKAAGAMVEAIQEDGKPTWLDQIRGRFLHPTDESLSKYAKDVLGTTWDGVAEPVHEVVDDAADAEMPVDPSAQLEPRRKAKTDKKKERAEAELLKTRESDPDDQSTLTDHMRKKALEDKKGKLDEQPAALLAAKKAKLHKEAFPAPSESEIDMGIFSENRGNLLEEIFAASAPPEVKTGKKPRKVDISQITPPASPPSRTVGLTPSRDGAGEKKKPIEVVAETVGEGGGDVAGDEGVGGKGKGVETELESSETTPLQTIYTKCAPGGDGATSGVVRSPQFEKVRADSWETRSPACDDLPHAPRWNLTQGSRMSDLANCHDFFSLSLPPAERMFQKRRDWFELLDDHVHAGVNFFATSQEILREWRLMGEETVEFENAKRALAEEREKFNAERKGLQWRVSDAERKLEEQKQLNIQKQKDWEIACERTNAEMQSQRNAVICLSNEKKELADEANRARLAAEKKEKEYVDRIDKLELLAQQKVSECQASELLAEEASADCQWLLSRIVPLLADRILNSPELATYMFELGQAGYNSGRKFGYSEGKAAVLNKEKDYHFELYK
ncbi:hypothetical protein Hdeb2414_s0034g00726341 [Helianthus debilis subsp. tardiflorus]